ncbi:MAG: aminomethyltransferase [Planctomycetaceae bacterium]|nr:MAG: aminomethyltransferase [Planctomycetaceae bacterium]
MPLQYSGIVEEHQAVRQRVGWFDISHMGRFELRGRQACAWLDLVLTIAVSRMQPGEVRYSLVCHSEGGILDDVLVYCFPESYWLVVNAANRQKIWDWLQQHRPAGEAHLIDHTETTAMLAIQGPRALAALPDSMKALWQTLKPFAALHLPAFPSQAWISRTGYTGEDGCELVLPAPQALAVWEEIQRSGSAAEGKPCGLGARDTLRLEAAMPLYGHELSEQIDPLTAGLGFAVKFDKPHFIGRQALLKIQQQPLRQRRIGLKLAGKRIARQGARVWQAEREVGMVSSGSFSPTLACPIAMAYVTADVAQPDTTLEVEIRGQREPAVVVPLPFYRRPRA